MHHISILAYRVAVVLSAVLAFGSFVLNPWFLPALPIGHSALAFPSTAPVFVVLGLANLGLGVATTVGLYMFWRWARPLSLVCIALTVVMYAMSAYFVDSGAKVAVDWLSSLLGGAVLALAYFSPIANRFGPDDGLQMPSR